MSTTYQVLFSASAAQPASDAEDSTAGQTAGESDCYNDGLTSEICDMAHDKCADVVGFCN